MKQKKNQLPIFTENISLQILKPQRNPSKINTKNDTPKHIIVQLLKTEDKKKILRAVRGKQHTTYRIGTEGDQPWDFFGRNEAKAEAPVLWPPHAKS